MAQLLPGKVGPGSLRYNVIHEQAATKTTSSDRHTHTQTHVTGGGRDHRRQGGRGCIIKLRTGVEGLGRGWGTHKFLASPGERSVAEVAGFLKHQNLHLKVQAAAFRFFVPEGCTSVLCFLGLRCICSDEVLHLGLLVPWSPRLLVKTALASTT